MTKKKKILSIKFLTISIFFIALALFLIYKEELKITVVNSFSEASADSVSYHVLDQGDKDIKSFSELEVKDKKTFIFINSSWCSLCDVITIKLNEKLVDNSNYIVYEADLDEFRIQLNEYKVSNAQKLILLKDGKFKLIDDINLNNLDQILATEI